MKRALLFAPHRASSLTRRRTFASSSLPDSQSSPRATIPQRATTPSDDTTPSSYSHPDYFIKLRRDIHQHPEIGFEEVRTAAIVAKHLESFNLDAVIRKVGRTGVVGTLRGRRKPTPAQSTLASPPTVGLRADMDALQMQEMGDRSYKSVFPGKAHLCGHDGHINCLLKAASLLAARREEFYGTINFIFQPAEEGRGGAAAMLGEGRFLSRFPCDRVFALHNWPGLPVGVVDVQPGPRMASSDEFDIDVVGVGGHAAAPHLCKDSIYVACALVTQMQSIVSRANNPADPLVISVTRFNGGTEAYNVIPTRTRIGGTLRTFSGEVRKEAMRMIHEVANGLCAAHGCRAEVAFHSHGYPPTVNDPGASEIARRAALKTVGPSKVSVDAKRFAGAEDFAYFLQQRPGCYLWLGAGVDAKPLHHEEFDFNDSLIDIGANLFVNIAFESLEEPISVKSGEASS